MDTPLPSLFLSHGSPMLAVQDSPAGRFLQSRGVQPADFNSYGSRRGNDDVMVRGTFANIRIKNLMFGGEEGGNTLYFPKAGGEPQKLAEYYAVSEDKLRALQLRASRRGLQLSDEVGRFILTRGTRSMSALFELLERLNGKAVKEKKVVSPVRLECRDSTRR